MSKIRISREDQRLASERYKLVGVHCASCKRVIEEALHRVPGVRYAVVDPNSGLLRIELEEGADRSRILREIRKLGYDAVTSRVVYRVRGLRSGASSGVRRALSGIRGVVGVSTFDTEGLVAVTYNPEETGEERILDALVRAGFRAEKVEASEDSGESGPPRIIALPLAGLALLAAGMLAGSELLATAGGLLAYAAAVKAFVAPAVRAALRGYATMDTLLALGTTGALV
ncbi:MAG: heavy-metal-associated domain-containing protein, partial [Desulfurococcales archaeon]|nr:heavy-metal-associated domain-containing protein [Desulfurococcales archaeon]